MRLTQAGAMVLALAGTLAAQQPTPVRASAVAREAVGEHRLVTGELRAVRRASVAAEEPGRVVELLAQEGQVVEAGFVLARVDSTRLDLELARLGADQAVERAVAKQREVEEASALREFEAVRTLAERDAARPKELADAETAWRAAQARLEQAKARVDALGAEMELVRERIADTEVAAPFDGVVTRRGAELGQWLATGDAVVELLSAGELEARLDVPQAYLAAVRASRAPLRVHVDATGETLELAERRLVPDVAGRGRSFPLIAPLPSAGSLAAGMSVTAWLPTGGEAEHLLVPVDAILRNETGTFVYVAAGGGDEAPRAQPAPIEVLFTTEGRAAVRSHSLAPGALVVVEGNERLYPTAPLAVTVEEGQ